MSLLKQIDDKGAVLSWSPLAAAPNLVALGTKDSAGIGFDDHGGELELHMLDFSNSSDLRTSLVGKSKAGSRFSSIAWSQMANFSSSFSRGLIAGGMVDGTINIWDPSKVNLETEDGGLIASIEQHHQGSVNGLHFNPHKESSHLLASGGADAEVYVWNLERPDEPTALTPASNAKHTADITQVAWNSQVVHILASAAQNGSAIVWDLRQKRAWCELREPSGGSISDIAWNPDQGLHLITASGDDKNPVLKLWDLRSSTSLPLATLSGHTEGVLSVSWCPWDTSLVMSCGKDNRTIMWDLFSLQPVYELPCKEAASASSNMYGHHDNNSGSVFGGLASSASHRRYHFSWSPTIPAVASASSFDRKVQFFSLTGARTKNGRAPKWLRRQVGATFGFGGKLVTIENVQTAASTNNKKNAQFGRLKIHQVAENPELTTSSDFFHEHFSTGKFKEYCEIKSNSDDISSQQVWRLMNVICYGKNPREELLTYLGFDSATITATAQAYLASKQPATEAPVQANGANSPFVATAAFGSPGNAEDVFGSTPDATSTSPVKESVAAPSLPTPEQSAKTAELLEFIKASEVAEPNILNAIIVGNFELAVDCCLSAGLLAEALLLSQCGGADLRAKTQAAYFEKQRAKFQFLNVLHAVIKNQLMDYVVRSDLLRWKETMAMLSTYGKSEEFPSLCEALASRLEIESGDRSSATLCYMCAANVARVVQFWTEELDSANLRHGKVDTLALQDYVEKILIFTQANPVSKLPEECGRYFANYAELLANQGRLSQAMTYLKSDAQPVAILVDRLYHAGNKPVGSRPPTFPFQRIQVEATINASTNAVLPSAAGTKAAPSSSAAIVTAGANRNVGASSTGAIATQSAVNPVNSPSPFQTHHSQSVQQQQVNQAQATASVAASAPVAPTTPTLPPGWLQLHDANTNMFYYVNQATGQSQWEPPAMAIEAPAQVNYQQQVEQQHQPQVQQPQPVVSQPQSSPMRPMVQQDIAFPNAAAANPDLVAAQAATAAAAAAHVGPDNESVLAYGQMIEAIAAGSLNAQEVKQVNMLRQSYQHLSDKMKASDLSGDVSQKIAQFMEYMQTRNFAGATMVQTDLVNTAWDKHKEWIKGMKIMIQLSSRK
jgi:protein transport protein SEC31